MGLDPFFPRFRLALEESPKSSAECIRPISGGWRSVSAAWHGHVEMKSRKPAGSSTVGSRPYQSLRRGSGRFLLRNDI